MRTSETENDLKHTEARKNIKKYKIKLLAA